MSGGASMDQWRDLYETAGQLKGYKPWDIFCDTDLLCIQPENLAEPVFVSVMGKAGQTFGIAMYEGMEGLADFDMIASSGEDSLPLDYVMFEQSCLCCYWGDREEVPPDQKKKITALGLKFRGRGQWLYFESYKRRYAPCIPDEREVLLMTEVLKEVLVLIKEVMDGELCANFDSGEALWRTYDQEEGCCKSYTAPMLYAQKEYPVLELSDEVMSKRLELMGQNDTSIAMEFAYLNMSISDENGGRPVNPLLFIAVDEDEGVIVTMSLLEAGEKEEEAALGFFVSYVLQYGRMDTIHARNPWILAALEKVCEDCDVALEEDDLDFMDGIIDELRQRLR